jgi:hypothetical protein
VARSLEILAKELANEQLRLDNEPLDLVKPVWGAGEAGNRDCGS